MTRKEHTRIVGIRKTLAKTGSHIGSDSVRFSRVGPDLPTTEVQQYKKKEEKRDDV